MLRSTYFKMLAGLVCLAALILALGEATPAAYAGELAPGEPEVGAPTLATPDCNIWWAEPLHDTFNPDYRSLVGPTTPGATVKLRLRVAQSDITSARVRVWDDRANAETYYPMSWDGSFDTDPTTYDWWFADIPAGSAPTILYYFFELNDAGDGTCTLGQDFYIDDNVQFYGGGYGAMSDNYNDSQSFQITVYDPAFSVPAWMQRGIVYQIFPDRFRDGQPSNDPPAGRFAYNQPGGTIVRSDYTKTVGSNNSDHDWNFTMCDPRGQQGDGYNCLGKFGDNFYGGDLAGVTQKISDGYFDNLGVSVLYLNPIFSSPSNHKYDTADYMTIDPDFGTLADFQALVAAAQAHDIKLILDGVFNHTSSDSKYFDRYKRYDAAGTLIYTNTVGINDGSGACEATGSSFRGWYYFPDTGTPGRDGDPGSGPLVYCAPPDPPTDPSTTYESWYGYGSLPKLQANLAAVRELIWSNGLQSVGPYWSMQGADGWRFDVGADVDRGLTGDPGNDYWEGFRAAVRTVTDTGKSDVLLMGEEWGDGSAWLLGHEWDSLMNYRFRSALLSWLFTGCVIGSNGCDGGTVFQDNDSNSYSSSGAISAISPSQFNARLRSIEEDYPPMAWKAMMNLDGSHDTNRMSFLLKKINNDNDSAALQRMKEWWLFAFTYAGAPALYYGSEIALSHDAVWDGSRWQDDPYNRTPYPWPDASGDDYIPVLDVLHHARKMASIRLSYQALQDGDVQHGIVIDDDNKLYGYARTITTSGGLHQTALIVLNRDNANHAVTLSGLNGAPYDLPDGTVLYDAVEGYTYTVTAGAVTPTVNSNWGVVLLEQDKLDRPAGVSNLGVTASAADLVLRWSPVSRDNNGERELATAYQIHRSNNPAFTPDASTLLAVVAPPDFGGLAGAVTYTDTAAAGNGYSYIVLPVNAVGQVGAPALLGASDNTYVHKISGPGKATFLGNASQLDIISQGTLTQVTLLVYPDTAHPHENDHGNGASMLDRYYVITPTGGGFTLSLCLAYDDAEVGGLSEEALQLCRWASDHWVCLVRSASSSSADNLVCADNVSEMSEWTINQAGPNAVALRNLSRSVWPGALLVIGLAVGGLLLAVLMAVRIQKSKPKASL